MNIKQELIERFQVPPKEFDSHETDLYVKYTRLRWEYLRKHYPFDKNLKLFRSQIDGKIWIEIPFAAWEEKFGRKINL
jgi:hypothetical protein